MILLFTTLTCIPNDFPSGLSLLQKSKLSTVTSKELVEAPQDLIQEAVLFHPFAEAAYTVIPHIPDLSIFSVLARHIKRVMLSGSTA